MSPKKDHNFLASIFSCTLLKLKLAKCPNPEVKRAFLFSLNTGLRWVDVKDLKWKSIDDDIVKLFQSKTGKEAIVYLNEYSMSLIPERGKREELVSQRIPQI